MQRIGRIVLLGLGLALASCTGSTSTDESPGEGSPAVPGEESAPLVWGSCEDDSGRLARTECAVLEVPIVHEDPSSGTIELALRRRPAEMSDRRVGVLVWVEGGPGGRGTDRLLNTRFSLPVRTRFDLVAWDPRGTSGTSRLSCNDDWAAENDPFVALDPDPDTDAELAEREAVVGELADRCLAQHGELLSRVGTYESVLDLDLIRQALGEDQISLIGGSYGSRVAAVYATLFPERVRAVVLDGYDDPNVSPLDHGLRIAAAFERQLNQTLEGCAADPACPFYSGGDPFDAFDALFESLEDQPLPATTVGHPPITQGMAYRVVEKYLYSEEDAPRMLAALQEAVHGDGTSLFRLYAENLEWEKAGGITPANNQAIICADRAGFWDSVSVEDKARFREELDSTAPRLGWRFGPNRIDPGRFQGGMCQIQPLEQSRMPVPVDAKDAGPILVIGTTGDVATPYEAAVQSVDDLDEGYLVTVEADHHGSYFIAVHNGQVPKYRCLLDTVHTYLIDLQIPPKGLICTGE